MSSKKESIVWPLILVAVGVIFLLNNLGFISGGFGTYWPIFLIIIGLGMIWKRS